MTSLAGQTHWRTDVVIIAPFFDGPADKWLDDFVEPCGYVFKKLRRFAREQSWHMRGKTTPLAEWREFLGYARRAFAERPDILVTAFPQLAFAAAFWKRVRFSRMPIIAWAFNLGSTQNKAKGFLAGLLLRSVDFFVVQSSEERVRYADWLGLPEGRFRFVPLQCGDRTLPRAEETQEPYLLAMGSAGRDYETLLKATQDFSGRMIVIAKEDIVARLPKRDNIAYLSNLTMRECEDYLAKARLNVVPVANTDTASGQVTFLLSMAYGVATIATDCPGTRDYLNDGVDALTPPHGDADALREAIESLWRDHVRREDIAANGKAAWASKFNDEAAARAFKDLLDSVAQRSAA